MKNKNTMIIGGVAVGVLLLLYLRRNNSSNDETLKSSGAGSSGGGGTGGGGGMFGGGGGGRPLPAETIVVNNTLRPLVMPRPLFARPQVSPIDSRPTTSPVSTIAPSVSPSVVPNIPNLPNIQAPLRSNFLTFDGRYSQSRGLDFGGIVE